jgi:hypothetical protein
MLPATLDILGRCVSIGLSQHWTEPQIEAVAAAIRQVHDQLR